MFHNNNILKFKKLLSTFVALNIFFLTFLPNYHYHEHKKEESCCNLTNQFVYGKKLDRSKEFSGFSVHNCPIEKFINLFTTVFIVEINDYDLKAFIKKFKLLFKEALELIYFINLYPPRSPPLF